jgi:hypothetical protein
MRDVAWHPGQVHIAKDFTDHDNGIFALKTMEQAEAVRLHYAYDDFMNVMGLYSRALPPCYVVGAVSLWGDVIEHEDGYRAQFAQIKSLDSFYDVDPMTQRELHERYKV